MYKLAEGLAKIIAWRRPIEVLKSDVGNTINFCVNLVY